MTDFLGIGRHPVRIWPDRTGARGRWRRPGIGLSSRPLVVRCAWNEPREEPPMTDVPFNPLDPDKAPALSRIFGKQEVHVRTPEGITPCGRVHHHVTVTS